MKTTNMLVAAVLLAAMPAAAQRSDVTPAGGSYFSSAEKYQHADLKKACVNYRSCLASTNEGVVSSAIAHVIRMKMVLQGQDFCDLKAAVDGLAITGPTPAIRYKAYLASLVLDNPRWFKEECSRDYAGPEELFTVLSNRLEKNLMGMADHKYVRPE